MYDTNSIGTNKGANAKCIPDGRKNPKKCNLWILRAIILIPIKRVNAKLKVTNIWLVIVKLYGIIPIKLLIIKKEKRKKINGKNCKPFDPIFFSTSVLLNKKTSSKMDCHLVGMTLLFKLIIWKNKIIKLKLNSVKIVEFVIFKYRFLKWKSGIIEIISNCSRGVEYIISWIR